MEKNMEGASMNTLMGMLMKDISLTASEKERESIPGLTRAITRETGKETKCMAMPFLFILMDRPSKPSSKMTQLFKKL